ncbi:hypothetical protein [Lawsonella clevelandensis]|mgnify:CR=1 FL=1|uniref:hypothetical protein n=1 Tax=Lawsonella clevelandensis TaxID=1528099 RepID=UPI0023F12000|nr:hypothetical protein [Lawsonella clevelandensis]
MAGCSRRGRVSDPGRRQRGTMQRLELAMGIVGTITILALLTLVMALVQGTGAALTGAAIIFLVAAVVFIALAIWYRKVT